MAIDSNGHSAGNGDNSRIKSSNQVITLTIDGRPVNAEPGITLLEVLRAEGYHVPTLCYARGLHPSGSCRMCVVEVDGMRRLTTSCTQRVHEGMAVRTQTPRVLEARRTTLELMLANHPDDCLYCVRSDTCELRRLAAVYGVERCLQGRRRQATIDRSSPALVRNPEKCILCGRCVQVCQDVQKVGTISFLRRGFDTEVGVADPQGLAGSECVHCGQCVRRCPTGALVEADAMAAVDAAMADPGLQVVAQVAPAVRVSVAQEFGLRAGSNVSGKLVSALKIMGVDKVFDTNFAADLTIMEEVSELLGRLRDGGPLPLVTSCCPAWTKFAEQYYPDRLDHVSSCKSPQMMMGAILHSPYARSTGTVDRTPFVVAIMPCTAKKYEAAEIGGVDAVLTTRELIRMLKRQGLNLAGLRPSAFDPVFGESTGAGVIFGVTGGVAEAALRTAYHQATGGELPRLDFAPVRGFAAVKDAAVQIGETTLHVAVINGLGQVRDFFDRDGYDGWNRYHFIEVMACPGGCIGGGGQPHAEDWPLGSLMDGLYVIDANAPRRQSHQNREVQHLYDGFLGNPNSPVAHGILHRTYVDRSPQSTAKGCEGYVGR